MRKAVSAALLVFALAGFVRAQGLGGSLGQVGSQYGQAYVAPLVNAFGVDMNSGLFHSAGMTGILPFGLHLYVGVQVGGALLGSSDKSFSMTYQDTLYSPLFGKQPATYTVTNAPTVFGSKEPGKVVITPEDPLVPVDSMNTIGGLINTSIAPLPIPQIGIGSIFGTDVLVRFLPKISLSDYGSVQLFGIAVRHSISQYIPLVPVDIAVQIGFQNFTIKDSSGGNLLKASTFAANVEVSKTFAILTLYGGLQMESSSVDVSYTYNPGQGLQPVPVSFSLSGKNKFRALVGLNLGLGPLTINGDYSVGAMNAVTLGVGISI